MISGIIVKIIGIVLIIAVAIVLILGIGLFLRREKLAKNILIN